MKIGDKVAYSVQFLKSIGMSHSDMAFARGIITEFTPLGKEPNCTVLANIDWGVEDEFPKRVNTKNLAIVGPNRKFCNVD